MTKICPICGYRNRDSAEYCERCLFNLSDTDDLNPKAENEEGIEGMEEGLGVYCPNGHWNPPGAKFCQVCGVPLEDKDTQEELLLPPEESEEEEKGQIMKIYKLVSHDAEFLVELSLYKDKVKEMLIGRKSGKNIPDVDLTGLKGAEVVSRRHANLILDGNEGEIYVVDLGSTNGTFVNGEKLKPGEKIKLKIGDEILFGKGIRFVLEEG